MTFALAQSILWASPAIMQTLAALDGTGDSDSFLKAVVVGAVAAGTAVYFRTFDEAYVWATVVVQKLWSYTKWGVGRGIAATPCGAHRGWGTTATHPTFPVNVDRYDLLQATFKVLKTTQGAHGLAMEAIYDILGTEVRTPKASTKLRAMGKRKMGREDGVNMIPGLSSLTDTARS
jgi:hypothetical protein